MTNILGPDPSKGGTTLRPVRTIPPNSSDHWFNTCSDPSDPSATRLVADWFNSITGALRKLVRSAAVTDDETSDDLVAESMARYASLAIFGICTGAANTYTVSKIGDVVVPKALFDGMLVRTIINTPNTGNSTANVFGLGAKKVLTELGEEIAPGGLVGRVVLEYSATANSGAGAWIVPRWALSGPQSIFRFSGLDSGQTIAHNTSTDITTYSTTVNRLQNSTYAGGVLTIGNRDAGVYLVSGSVIFPTGNTQLFLALRRNAGNIAYDQKLFGTDQLTVIYAAGVTELVAGDQVKASILHQNTGAAARTISSNNLNVIKL